MRDGFTETLATMQSDSAQNAAVRTLRYWCDVETFTAPEAEMEGERGQDWFATHLHTGPLPWEPDRRPAKPHWHFVRFGVFPRKSYDAELLTVLKTAGVDDPDTLRTKNNIKPYTYLGIFAVGHDGLPIENSLQMAAFAPAFASLRSGKQVDFAVYQGRLSEEFNRRVHAQRGELNNNETEDVEESRRVPVDMDFIAAFADTVLKLLDWRPAGMELTPRTIVVSKIAVNRKGNPKEPQIAPVNGFFLPDLLAITSDLANGRPTGLVHAYLADPTPEKRRDCTTDEAVERALAPDRSPAGRWPSAFPLTLMQQVAVNDSLAYLDAGGIFSINGPPGTGKTTLLMDVVAAIMVRRAEILASFDQPQDAFTHKTSVKYPNQVNPAKLYAVDPRLHGFSIVVASSNNGAVENITREFPNSTKVDADLMRWKDPFLPLADALLGARTQGDEDEDEDEDEDAPAETVRSWGLVSAVLGRKSNRIAFVNTLSATRKESDGKKPQPEPWNIFELIRGSEGRIKWQEARCAFFDALARVTALQERVTEYGRSVREVAGADARIRALDSAVTVRAIMVDDAAAAEARAAAELAERNKDLDAAEHEAALHVPHLIDRLLSLLPIDTTLASRRVVAAHRAALGRCTACNAASREALTILRTRRTELEAARAALITARTDAAIARDSVTAAQAALPQLRSELGSPVTFDDFLAATKAERQQMLPGSSPTLDAARADLFLKAMALHRAFVVHAGRPFQSNLRRALGMLDGDAHLRPKLPEIAADLWATLFMLVPVVSSTFASFARCFDSMPRGGIGWLIVDEAGQAVPQQAIGALARAKRALVVGDPFQVPPVITLEPGVDERLREVHRARLIHRSTATSMQILADQANLSGTYLTSYDGQAIWVGSPLRVHRRCVEPMFSIANRIAYNGKMVLGRGKAEQEAKLTAGDPGRRTAPRPLIGPSAWFDVPGGGGSGEDHCIAVQADLVVDMVQRFMAEGWLNERRGDGLPDLCIVSPFKSVAKDIESRLWDLRSRWAGHIPYKSFQAWMKRSVGTVHTFQGKEAEAVILLLGGRTEGAIKWAASTPNLLNVAVTRAQRRLYVVGDWNAWTRWPLVKTAMGEPQWRVSLQPNRAKLVKDPS